uniref:Uncharacterized protein n=1 Tax=Globodera pallida TaxID=36090 RepID=A0A183CD44_GLOPA
MVNQVSEMFPGTFMAIHIVILRCLVLRRSPSNSCWEEMGKMKTLSRMARRQTNK